ncbi:MAG: prepilin-type N-terminal cleavage/methylation domain-containing protein [Lachnospiraceae bacterium]|nr:prepilin-type N-terminal cleavage/methylation domain-containing protein [Lachnospiraceae bacterium]
MDNLISDNQYSRLNNKGVSLVELIVVVLIMSILVSGAVMSVMIIHDANVGAASDKLEAMLSSTRKTSIAREADTVKLRLQIESDKCYAVVYLKNESGEWEEADREKLGSTDIVYKVIKTDGLELTVSESSAVEFSFMKSNGSLKEDYKQIVLEGSKTKTITVIKETGRCLADN